MIKIRKHRQKITETGYVIKGTYILKDGIRGTSLPFNPGHTLNRFQGNRRMFCNPTYSPIRPVEAVNIK